MLYNMPMYARKLKSWAKHFDFLIGDVVALTLSYALAILIRQKIEYEFWWHDILEVGWISLVIIYIVTALATSAYKNIIRRDRWGELRAVISQIIVTFAIFVIYLYAFQLSFVFSRLIFGFTGIISLFAIYAERIVWKRIIRNKILKNHDLSKMILIAKEETAAEIIREFNKRPYDLFELCGVCIVDKDMKGEIIEKEEVVCNVSELKDYLVENVIDEAYISVGSGKRQNEIVDFLLEIGVVVHVCLMMNSERLPNRMTERIGGHMVVTTSNHVAETWMIWTKRFMDIIGAVVGVIATGVLYLYVAPKIKKVDPGPVLFKQKRVGKNGREFNLYKFRSMYLDAEERKAELMKNNEMDGLMFKMEDDPRILPGIGEKIRRTSIDEFPQFINVLLGDMSLVGTRPPTVDEFKNYAPHHKMRLSFKPGITGLWQVSGRNNITDFEEVVELDNEYIKTWSIWSDIKILVKTVFVVLKKEGAK
ncbi:MAG: sugar transferase [Lachnospiraceae bacterium]|nr:sugar transferase [Lachnospiraceae bacterium]